MRANHMETHKQKNKEMRRKGKKHHQLQAIRIGNSVTSALAEHAHSTGLPLIRLQGMSLSHAPIPPGDACSSTGRYRRSPQS